MLSAMPHRGEETSLCNPAPGFHLGTCFLPGHDSTITTDSAYTTALDGALYPTGGWETNLSSKQRLAAAYHQFGEAGINTLNGEFAYAHWDRCKQTLILARDPFGNKPLFYHRNKERLIFASEIKALLALSDTPANLHRDRVADFFLPELEGIDKQVTFYQGIYRVPSGHYLRLRDRSTTLHAYWKPESGKDTAGPFEDHVGLFRDTLREAVTSRIGKGKQTGVLLSGGLDSCAVAAVASQSIQHPLNTYSLVLGHHEPDCPESASIATMLAANAFDAHQLTPGETLANVPSFTSLLGRLDNPFSATLLAGPIPLYALAKRSGMGRLLDGVDGDLVTSLTGNYPWFLANEFGFGTGWQEIYYEACYFEERLKLPFNLGRFAVRQVIHRMLSRERFPRPQLRRWQSSRALTHQLRHSPINEHFQSETHLLDRIRQQRENEHPRYPKTIRDASAQTLTAPYLTAAIERYEEAAALFSLEASHPLLDISLVKLCLSLPWHTRIRQGMPKWILREAMKAHLPSEIITQHKLPNIGGWFSDHYISNYLEHEPTPPRWLLERLEDFLNIDNLKAVWMATASLTPHADKDNLVPQAIALAEWLRARF